MPKKFLLAIGMAACVCCFTPAAIGAPDTATSPPDSAASVNADPNGVWPTAALAAAHDSRVVGPASSHGCPSAYGCGWKYA